MYENSLVWFFNQTASKQKAIKKAVRIMERAGLQTCEALEILYQGSARFQVKEARYAQGK